MKITRFGPIDAGHTAGSGNAAGGAGGDLTGGFPAPTVTGIDGKALTAPGTVTNGQTVVFNSGTGSWDYAASGASPLTTKGDLFGYDTASARVPVGSNGQVLTADSTDAQGVSWQTPSAGTGPGAELDYVQFTANVSPTATTEGTANTVVTGTSISLDGSTSVMVEYFCSQSRPAATANAQLIYVLLDGSTVLGTFGVQNATAAANAYEPVLLRRRLATPSAGSHQYIVKAYVSTGTALIAAGAGGTGANVPGYIRVQKV